MQFQHTKLNVIQLLQVLEESKLLMQESLGLHFLQHKFGSVSGVTNGNENNFGRCSIPR